MKLAVMQPYLLPYIGYWQLVHAVDTFVLLDDVQYIRHGWINRNRILKHGGGWQYIMIPLQKHAKNELIKNICAHNDMDWKGKIIRQLAHYGYKKKAPFYGEVIKFMNETFSKITIEYVTRINEIIIKEVSGYLGISTQILVSSDQKFNYKRVQNAGEWALRIAEEMGAEEYINPIAGAELFDPSKFHDSKIKLSLLKSNEIRYDQRTTFEPSLSIVDVLMFNGQQGTKELLDEYSLRKCNG